MTKVKNHVMAYIGAGHVRVAVEASFLPGGDVRFDVTESTPLLHPEDVVQEHPWHEAAEAAFRLCDRINDELERRGVTHCPGENLHDRWYFFRQVAQMTNRPGYAGKSEPWLRFGYDC